MVDLQDIIEQLRKIAADNEAFRQEQARLRESDKREQAKHRLLDRQYLDQRLLSMETSFSQKLADVSSALAASSSSISSQSSKRSRDTFEPEIQCRPDEDSDIWFRQEPPWADPADVDAVETVSEPPLPGTLQHSQLLSQASAHTDTVLKVLPSDNPRQCLLCGVVFKHKRSSKSSALFYLYL